jgi:signal transduction histidine kinase
VATAYSHESRQATIQVADNGYGIEGQHLQHIFDPFFTTKPTGEGTGLGLSVSYGIVKKHGGEILVESKPGEGSTFTVVLPVLETNSGGIG